MNSASLWSMTYRRLKSDKVSMCSLFVVLFFIALLLLSSIGLIASDWEEEVGVSYAPPSFVGKSTPLTTQEIPLKKEDLPENPRDPLRHILQQLKNENASELTYGIKDPLSSEINAIQKELKEKIITKEIKRKETLPLGADKWGHDVLKKTIKGAETSIVVGLVAAFIATLIGTAFGALAGYFGGKLDDFFNWFYNVFTSIPYLLLILAVAAVLQKKGMVTIILILGLTGWTGVFRLVRAEYMRHKEREYVMAANTIGASHWTRMFSHIFPNVSHIPLVQMSILVVSFIKSEVILSFLGFGVPVGVVSWGSMLNEVQNELILGKWWQLLSVTFAMALLITAFSLFTDGLRDALDPRLREG